MIKSFSVNKVFSASEVGYIQIPSIFRGFTSIDEITLTQNQNTADKYLEISAWRFSLDGINFTAPMAVETLTLPQINDFAIVLIIERKGSDDSSDVILNSVQVEGGFLQERFDLFSFPDYINIEWDNIRWNKIWANLLLKCYKNGIIPEYISRGEGDTFSGLGAIYILSEDMNNIIEETQELFLIAEESGTIIPTEKDKDYIDFWKTLCYFHAAIIELSFRRIKEFDQDEESLESYLEQKTLLFCDEADLNFFQSSLANIWSTVKSRGTMRALEEIKDIICFQECDEFLFKLSSFWRSGLTLNENSLLTRSLNEDDYQMNKSPLKSKDFNSLQGFSALGIAADVEFLPEEGIGLFLLEDGGNLLLENGDNLLIAVDEVRSVMRVDSSQPFEFEFEAVVDPNLSYQFSCYIKFAQDTSLSLTAEFFDCDDESVTIFNLQGAEEAATVEILDEYNDPINGQYRLLRFNLMGADSAAFPAAEGNNVMSEKELLLNEEARKVFFKFVVNDGETFFYALKFEPINLPVAELFLNSYRNSWLLIKNRNERFTNKQLLNFFKEYLLPYGVDLTYASLDGASPAFLLLEDSGIFTLENENFLLL